MDIINFSKNTLISIVLYLNLLNCNAMEKKIENENFRYYLNSILEGINTNDNKNNIQLNGYKKNLTEPEKRLIEITEKLLSKDSIKTCKECNNIEEIKVDLEKLLQSIENILKTVLDDINDAEMNNLSNKLYFAVNETDIFKKIDKFQILLNLFDDDLQNVILEERKDILNDEEKKIITNFKKNFKNNIKNLKKIDIIDYLANKIKESLINDYQYKYLSEGSFGATYISKNLPRLLVKLTHDSPKGKMASSINTETDKKELKIKEYRHYLKIKDKIPDYLSKYYINLWHKISILQTIKGDTYSDFDSMLKSSPSKDTKLKNTLNENIIINIYISNCFNDLQKYFREIMRDRRGKNMIICKHGYIFQIDNDAFSFLLFKTINIGYTGQLARLILENQKDTIYQYLTETDFDCYETTSKYFGIYDVDFLYSIINNKYKKTLMFYISNLFNSLRKINNTYCNEYNKNAFTKILKFINNFGTFKNNINSFIDTDRCFSLYSIIYNGKDKDCESFWYSDEFDDKEKYKILQNNLKGTGGKKIEIEKFINYLFKIIDWRLTLNNPYFATLESFK